jgi:hypothetical protein
MRGLAFVACFMMVAIVREAARMLSSSIAFRNLLTDARLALVFSSGMDPRGKATILAR